MMHQKKKELTPLCVLVGVQADFALAQLLQDVVHLGLKVFLLDALELRIRCEQTALICKAS